MFSKVARRVAKARNGFLQAVLLSALCSCISGVRADPVDQGHDFEEPIFGLTYNPSDANFVRAQTDELLRICSAEVTSAKLPPHVAIFASYETPARRIYVVGQGDNSALFVIQGETCSSGVPSLALSQIHHSPGAKGDAPALTNEEIASLFHNALERYAEAFGGKSHFLQWLDVTSERMRSGCKGLPNLWCPPTYHSLAADLKAYLTSYRNGILTDPIFNLPFDRASAHFEMFQSSLLLPQCKKLLLDYSSLPEKLALYAKHQTDSVAIFIAGSEDNVAIYVIRGDRCEVGVPALAMVGGHNNSRWVPPRNNQPELSNEEVSSLFSDALSRYANAFGGREDFLKWIDRESEHSNAHCDQKSISCPPTYRSMPTALKKILDDYRLGPGSH